MIRTIIPEDRLANLVPEEWEAFHEAKEELEFRALNGELQFDWGKFCYLRHRNPGSGFEFVFGKLDEDYDRGELLPAVEGSVTKFFDRLRDLQKAFTVATRTWGGPTISSLCVEPVCYEEHILVFEHGCRYSYPVHWVVNNYMVPSLAGEKYEYLLIHVDIDED